ncbi:hypothetical protein HDU96_000322 [Phlyctochytrium bullatum]|nr:hypothetical protein HDU96_000322 [Phlyctochytrium bullatum]
MRQNVCNQPLSVNDSAPKKDVKEKEPVAPARRSRKSKAVEREARNENKDPDETEDDGFYIDLAASSSDELLHTPKKLKANKEAEDDLASKKEHPSVVQKRKVRAESESEPEYVSDEVDEDEPAPKRAKKVNLVSQRNKPKGRSTGPSTASKSRSRPSAVRKDENDDDEDEVGENLEPINKIKDMFEDMVRRNPRFVEAIKKLNGRPLRVATMCSGTESPLLALQLISRAIMSQHDLEFAVDHVFSCEIEPFKQAYIERNFSPPLLFRDVRELGDEEATTAYGAKMPVPGDVDLLIAGTSCVDYSNLNNQKQTLDAKGESGETFRGMLRWVEKNRPPLVVLENVCSAPWDKIVKRFDSIDYYARDLRLDTKHFYIPHTRTRGYLLAVPKGKVAYADMVDEWAELVKSLKRMSSTPLEDYLIPTDDPRIHRAREDLGKIKDENARRGRLDWSRCQSRHSFQRLTEELGTQRPLTAWSEGGMSNLPDYAWNDWGRAQTDRVLDLMDINFLRMAKKGIDVSYKTLVWNLSQNVDRTTASGQMGICPCLTPSMIPFITNRGGPVVGLEALSLQGIPVDELLLTRETEDQLADLAGNAMTSTVVGTCMMAAITLGLDSIIQRQDKRSRTAPQFSKIITGNKEKAKAIELEEASRILGDELLQPNDFDLTCTQERDLDDLLALAGISSRFCVCEGRSSIALSPVKRCKDCSHTACGKCGGRPEHSFKETKEIITAADRLPPQAFENALSEILPVRLVVTGFSEDALVSMGEKADVPIDFLKHWAETVAECLKDEFRLSCFRRQEIWTCIYLSTRAKLLLCLDQKRPSWKLVVNPPFGTRPDVASVLTRPVARMEISIESGKTTKQLLDGEWTLCVPKKISFDIELTGSDPVDSWEARIGLDGPFKDKKAFREYKVSGSHPELERNIDGVYRLLPKCGTASESLHKRLDDDEDSRTPCQRCAPAPPQIVWVPKKSTKAFEGVEDPAQAAIYEQSLKNRPSAFVCQIREENSTCEFRIGVNYATLIHRALSRFPFTSLQDIALSWRITAGSGENDFERFKPFKLLTNKSDAPYSQPPNFSKYPLRPEQLRSLSWMVQQEAEDIPPFIEEEISEADLDYLGWRAEGRVTRSITVRGGVVADQVGYGKTAITLGLIDVMKEKQAITKATQVPGLIPLKATLVLVPGHLLNQWPDEIKKFLGKTVKVEVIKDMNSLNKLSIEDLEKADIVVASSKILSSVNYWENLELLSASGRLPTNGKGGRYFLARYEEALKGLRQQMELLVSEPGAAAKVVKMMEDARNKLEDVTVLEPSKRLIGKSFQEEAKQQPKKQKTAPKAKATSSSKPRLNADPWNLKTGEVRKNWKRMRCPPFEVFHWNRIVVDEFTYLEDRILAAVTNFSSTFRWSLSGTPPLKDFQDIKSIAVFLGVHLGVDDEADFHSAAAKKRRKEATKVEQFHAFREIHSVNWHARRHAHAQTFLDGYVRQNVAEIDEIPFEECIVFIRLPSAERAIYLELEHHLSAMEMNSKKAIRSKKETDGDREKRMLISLGSSANAEEALLKRCSHFDVEVVNEMRGIKRAVGKNSKGGSKRKLSELSESEESAEESGEESDEDAPARPIPTRKSAQPKSKEKQAKDAPAEAKQPAQSHRLTALETCDKMVEIRQSQLDDCCRDILSQVRRTSSFREFVRRRRDFIDRLPTLQPGESSEDFEKWLLTVCNIKADDEGDQEAKDILMTLISHAGCNVPEKWASVHEAQSTSRLEQCNELQIAVKPRISLNLTKKSGSTEKSGSKKVTSKKKEVKQKKGRRVVSSDTSGSDTAEELSDEHDDEDREDATDEEGAKNDLKLAQTEKLEELLFEIRERTHVLRRLDRELVGRVRSLRFLLVVRNLLQDDFRTSVLEKCSDQCPGSAASARKGKDVQDGNGPADPAASIDGPMCLSEQLKEKQPGSLLPLRDIAILSCCGHIGCFHCMDHAAANSKCPVQGCGVRSHEKALVRASELGSVEDDKEESLAHEFGGDSNAPGQHTRSTNSLATTFTMHGGDSNGNVQVSVRHVTGTTSGTFGAKLMELVRILQDVIQKDEKALVFVQFPDLMEKVAEALDAENIGYLQIKGTTHQKSTALQAFQQQQASNHKTTTGKAGNPANNHVLLLHVMDESAAGANLTVANHVVFVGPLLTPTQEVYTAAETQAIGRARRYGQTRRVYIHRLITTRTIDEQIYRKRIEHVQRQTAALKF